MSVQACLTLSSGEGAIRRKKGTGVSRASSVASTTLSGKGG